MKILYVGNFTDFNSPLGYCPNAIWIQRTLEELGHEVTSMNECDVDVRDIILEVNNRTYDFILCEEGRLFGDHINDVDTNRTVIQGKFKEVMEKSGIPVVPWLTNIFFSIMRREYEIDFNPIFKADIVFTTDGGHQKEFEAKGINHVCLRQGIFEAEAFEGQPTYPTKAEIVFVGSIYEDIWPYRKELIDFLQRNYGTRFLHVGNRGEVRHEALNNLLATVKIVIGDSVYSPHYWSNRIYEMIGRGGFLIHPMIPGLDEEFKPYEHFVPYNMGDFEGLREKIDYFLTHDEEREKIRKAGFNFCKENYTYKHRVQDLLRILKEKKIIKA